MKNKTRGQWIIDVTNYFAFSYCFENKYFAQTTSCYGMAKYPNRRSLIGISRRKLPLATTIGRLPMPFRPNLKRYLLNETE
jgi:hypothetical protein